MLQRRTERQDVLLRRIIVTRRQEQSTERDKHIPAPSPGPPSSKVRETRSEARHGFAGIQRRGLDEAVHLDGRQRQVLREGVSVGDEVGTLLDGGATGGLVSLVDDDGEVLGAEEGRYSGLDLVEALLEPCGGLRQAGEGGCLPVTGNRSILDHVLKHRRIGQTVVSDYECSSSPKLLREDVHKADGRGHCTS